MPTQEERLSALERTAVLSQKFQQQAVEHIRETNENTTILLGVIRSQGHDIRHMAERLDTMDARLERLEGTSEAHTTLLNEHTTRLDRVETTLSDHTTRLDRIEAMLSQILERLPAK